MRVALGQINPCLGDIAGNLNKMRSVYTVSAKLGADILIFPEMCVCGYPPEDLLLKKHFLLDNRSAVEQLAAEYTKMTVITGLAEVESERTFNSLAILQDGRVSKVYHKIILPNYGVFDEQRYFQPGTQPAVIQIDGLNLVLSICEDLWQLDRLDEFLKEISRKDVIINISASPFHVGKIGQRQQILGRCAKHFNCAVAYCNLVGGQDELVFDGRSMFIDPQGAVIGRAKAFAEDLIVADITLTEGDELQIKNVKPAEPYTPGPTEPIDEVYDALVLGTTDYVTKNGFEKVIIGLSGGIDSSLVAAIAVDALGAQNVVGITMPSKFNSPDTIGDAEKLADNLGIAFLSVPIRRVLDKFNETLAAVQDWDEVGIAYENLQARIRGTILMSLSNQFGYLVLTTGNKSETAVGYSTLYGDTAGGFAVIKDVPKTMVYQLAGFINHKSGREIIPVSVIKRPPSAELKANQADSDSLPDYSLLDEILKGYIELDKSARQLTDAGLPRDIVKRVIRMVDRNEYKRRQSPPGIKITPKAFGKDRRMPITNRYTTR
ncbi:MAG TPA: NAD+ synthase [Planctomycetes bacterium]|nr:NAD+ synthase [Planctomycetota bacterium]